MKVITVINQKGGVGKTTTAYAVGEALLLKGYKVLFVDTDPQGNLTKSLGGNSTGKTVASVLFDSVNALEAIQASPLGDVIPSSPMLASTDKVLTGAGDEYKLKEALSAVSGYDYILIDTPPSLSTITVNALTASSGILIPAQADIFSLDGVGQLQGTIEAVRKYCNPSLRIYGIVLTRYSARAIFNRDAHGEFISRAEKMDTRLFSTAIRECISVKEALALRSSLFKYAPKSTGAQDYLALTEELLEVIKETTK